MCGIIGASSPKNVNVSVEDIKTLYLVAEERGGHACGFTDGQNAFKSIDSAYDFINKVITSGEGIEDKENPNVKRNFPKNVGSFIGHTRFATYGNKNDKDNAHPFSMPKMVGVHNGSIRNFKDLKSVFDLKYQVDSKLLYHLINKYGIHKTLPLLQGQLALAYFEHKTGDIILYRWDKPLYVGNKGQSMFFASQEDHLQVIGCTDTKLIQEHTIYRVSNGQFSSSRNVKKKLSPTKQDPDNKKKPTLLVVEDKVKYLRDLEDDNVNQYIQDYKEIVKEMEEVIHTPEVSNEVVPAVPIKDEFSAPIHARQAVIEYNGNETLYMYWFKHDNPNVLFLESNQHSVKEVIDMGTAHEREKLRKRNKNLYNAILIEFHDMKDRLKEREKFQKVKV